MYPFSEGSFAVRNGWYVAAFADEAKRELLSRWILNEPVVIYRKEDGTAVAIGGRCPHRHFPLGKGCLKGDTVVCGYHGIVFGPDGKCVSIPSQKAVPGVYRVKQYPLVERGLWLWIWPGDPALADESLLPDLDEAGYNDPESRFRPLCHLDVGCRYQLLNDNLLDLTHLAYLHRSSIGTEENASWPEELEESDRMLRSRRFMRGVPLPEMLRQVSSYDGPVDRVFGMDFYLPGFHAGIDDTLFPENHPTRAGEILTAGWAYHGVTPATPTTTHYFVAHGGRLRDADFDFVRASVLPVLDEDVVALGEIENMVARLGSPPPELMLKADTGSVRARRALQAMMDRERNVQPSFGGG